MLRNGVASLLRTVQCGRWHILSSLQGRGPADHAPHITFRARRAKGESRVIRADLPAATHAIPELGRVYLVPPLGSPMRGTIPRRYRRSLQWWLWFSWPDCHL